MTEGAWIEMMLEEVQYTMYFSAQKQLNDISIAYSEQFRGTLWNCFTKAVVDKQSAYIHSRSIVTSWVWFERMYAHICADG